MLQFCIILDMSFTLQNVYAVFLKALVAWREARGEPTAAQLGVIWTVENRAAKPGWWGKDEVSVILFPEQYSSFNKNDPNATKFPAANDPVFTNILVMAQAPGVDPTNGATHYYSGDAVPYWAAQMTHTVDLGALHFFKQS